VNAVHIAITTPESATVNGGLWSRGLAKLIDGILLALCVLPLDLLFRTSFVLGKNAGFGRTASGEALVVALFCLYEAVMESSRRQATFGKRALGILVTDLDGSRIPFRRALLRSVLQVFAFGYLLAAFTARKQALHDIVADTEVLPGSL
jgi:uncharacterized RDD family membrane protein YckC